MAIVTCGECGGKVSDQAKACPHCGMVIAEDGAARVIEEQQKTRRHRFFWEFLAGLVVLAVFAGIVVFMFDWMSKEQEKERAARAKSTCSASVAQQPGGAAIAAAGLVASLLMLRRRR